ncbi:MAG: hypothetical protein ACK5YI_12645, partial [Rhodospirillales bacterium]
TVALASTARVDASGPMGGTVTLGAPEPAPAVLPTRRPATRTVAADKGSVVVAAGASGDGGTVTVAATQAATLGGTLAATGGTAGAGGTVSVTAGFAGMGGMVDASGGTGGTIAVTASGTVSLAETVRAIGTRGAGGRIDVAAGGVLWETSTSLVDTSGRAGGSVRITAADGLTTSGTWRAVGTTGAGGSIDASGWGMRLLSATADASGLTAGGTVRIGGEYQGGKGLSRDDLPNAVRLYANDATRFVADARGPAGDGGTVIVWADRDVLMQAAVSAVPGAVSGKGGFVEVSAGDRLTFAGTVAAGAPGRPGTVLFDPKNITIGTPTGFSPVSILIGTGYVRGTSYALDSGDQFGASVALNIDANRMAVGAPSDDGFGNGDPNTGAVHLFTFSDTNFNGGSLVGIIGSGYVGGSNVNLASVLSAGDLFGRGVALSTDGTRLAVGAPGDDGSGNGSNANDYGAVRLFTFGPSFASGSHHATFGFGYGGTNDRNMTGLIAIGDNFGWSVALNGTGNRLAGGAPLTDNVFNNSGAVHVFTFTDASGAFTGSSQIGTIGPYFALLDLNASIAADDLFGYSVAMNQAGDRMVVGAV